MGEKLIRFSPVEDKILLETWWDSNLHEETAQRLGRTVKSCNFRYYKVLKDKGIDPTYHKAKHLMQEKKIGSLQIDISGNNEKSQTAVINFNDKLGMLENWIDELSKEVEFLKQENDDLKTAVKGLQTEVRRLKEKA